MSEQNQIPTLNIKDRLNYPYLLASQILTFQKAILNTEFSEREIEEAINGLVEMIPESWKDEEWKKEYEAATKKTVRDLRPLVAGRIRLSEQVCEELGIPAFETVESKDTNKLFHACINLLDRRGLVSRINKMEQVETGILERIETDTT